MRRSEIILVLKDIVDSNGEPQTATFMSYNGDASSDAEENLVVSIRQDGGTPAEGFALAAVNAIKALERKIKEKASPIWQP